MEALFKYCSASLLSLCALFAPISPLVTCVVIFISVDFVTGVWASRKEAQQVGQRWYFESDKAWKTLYKLGFTLIAIAMTWMMELFMIDFVEARITKLFTGFICGVELWSFLENAAQISDAPLFQWMRQYVHRRIKKEIDNEK